MIKKLRILLLGIFLTLFLGSAFADIMPDNSHRIGRCTIIQNKEIDNYKVVIGSQSVYGLEDIYEPGKCLKGGYMTRAGVYLLDKSDDIDEITKENIQDKAIQIGLLDVNGGYVDNSNPITYESEIYKVVKDGNDYKLKTVKRTQGIVITNNSLDQFPFVRLVTVLIETLILFLMVKIFRKRDQISNLRILLVGFVASSITLPLLWFVIPPYMWDYLEYTVIGELIVILLEILIIKYGLKISRKKAVLASIICNLCSYLFGLFVTGQILFS